MPLSEKQLIAALRKGNRRAQKQVYDQYGPKMFAICLRYLKDYHRAEDLLVEGFYKIMTRIEQYKDKGSFEGWMRRIFVNECLMLLRKKHNFHLSIEGEEAPGIPDKTLNIENKLEGADILALLEQLPVGYRTIFNLYVVEGYKHREIAELLGISINTSKSQLILAKKRLQKLLIDMNYPGVNAYASS